MIPTRREFFALFGGAVASITVLRRITDGRVAGARQPKKPIHDPKGIGLHHQDGTEVSGAGYSRVAVPENWNNAKDITFDAAEADWGEVAFVSVPHGSGRILIPMLAGAEVLYMEQVRIDGISVRDVPWESGQERVLCGRRV
jgi:hypothetical protein